MGGAASEVVEDDVSLEPPPDLDMTSYLLIRCYRITLWILR